MDTPQPFQFGIVCTRCDTYNSPGLSVCQSCGAALTPASGFTGFFAAAEASATQRAAVDDEAITEPDVPPAPPGAAPAAAPATGPHPAAPPQTAAPATPPRLCSVCKAEVGAEAKFCGQCGAPLSGGTMVLPAAAAAAARESQAPAGGGTQFFGAMQAGRAKLILIRGEGFEGAEYRLNADSVGAGRSQGLVLFPSDDYLAPLHATFLYRDGRLHVRDEGSKTGTWVRLRGATELTPGAEFVVGAHRLRYAGPLPPPAAADPAHARMPGAPRPEGAVRLEEVLAGGRPGRTFVVGPGEVSIGRSGCTLTLDDEYVSGRHAVLSVQGGRAYLSDAGSVNGTFVRIPPSTERGLAHGDYLMMGLQVLRVEVAR